VVPTSTLVISQEGLTPHVIAFSSDFSTVWRLTLSSFQEGLTPHIVVFAADFFHSVATHP
jgi:hypothetical protein